MSPVLAHRGYAARYPENTLEALDAAVEAGAGYVEFDVQLAGDGVPHLLHDDDFMRTAGRHERIFDLDTLAVADISVGEPERFGQQFQAVRAPTLTAVADWLAAHPQVTAFVEIKRQSIDFFGRTAVLDAVLDVLAEQLTQCVVISFDADITAAARAEAGCRTGWALREWSDAARIRAEQLAPDYLFCNVVRLPPSPDPLWTGPWQWVVYEITDAQHARELLARGVSLIESMAVAEMLAALRESPPV